MTAEELAEESIRAAFLRARRICGEIPSDRQAECKIRAEIEYYESLIEITDSTASDALYQDRIDELEALL
jgi:hypothetical protein